MYTIKLIENQNKKENMENRYLNFHLKGSLTACWDELMLEGALTRTKHNPVSTTTNQPNTESNSNPNPYPNRTKNSTQ